MSKRVNLLLSATALESLAPAGHDEMGEVDSVWLAEEPNVEVLIRQKLSDLRGPADGKVADDEIRAYEDWYAHVASEIVGAVKAA